MMSAAMTSGSGRLSVASRLSSRSQSVDVAVLEQGAAHRLSGSALEQHVVGHHHRSPAVDLQDRLHVLNEVELLVGGRSREVLPYHDERAASHPGSGWGNASR